jgi:hypothetical protein
MDDNETSTTNNEGDPDTGKSESWLAEQARLVLLEDGG